MKSTLRNKILTFCPNDSAKRFFIIPLSFLFINVSLFSQSAPIGKINSRITDESAKPLSKVSILLFDAKDSVLTKAAISNTEGKFEFENIKEGTYYITATHTGFQKFTSNSFSVTANKPLVTLPEIKLLTNTQSLSIVTVTAQRPLFEQKLDRLVVNVEGSIISTGSNVLEVIERSPGVFIDQDGIISMKGKQGVIVMIDDKPTFLSAQDLATMLRGMNSTQVDRIEIMTNPPAKYDAAGNAGIINIRMKKDQRLGANGIITFGAGDALFLGSHNIRINSGINFNYRNKKLNIFGNYNFSYREQVFELSEKRNFYDNNFLETSLDLKTRTQINITPHNARLGMDYFAGKNTTLGLLISGNGNYFKPEALNTTLPQSFNGQPIQNSQTHNQSDDRWENMSANFNVKQKLDTSGQEISVDLDYAIYDRGTSQVFTTTYFDNNNMPSGDLHFLRGKLPGRLTIRAAKTDYTLPLKKNKVLSLGIKSSRIRNENNITFFEQFGNNPEKYDSSRSNHFIYEEKINAVYANYRQEFKKWTMQIGLRAEQTIANGNQVITSTRFSRNYWQLFPTFFVSRKLSEKHEITVSTGRRIDRPGYGQLNPFKVFRNPYNYSVGNPYLQPQITQNFEIRHLLNGKIATTLNYSKTKDVINFMYIQVDSIKTFYQTPDNVATLHNIGIAVNSPLKFTKWWTGNLSVNAFHNRYKGIYLSENVDINRAMLEINLLNNFQLPKGFRAELSGFYRTKGLNGIFQLDPFGFIGAGIQKTIIKGKGTLRFNVTDMFFTDIRKTHVRFSNQDAEINFKRDSRTFNLNFTYRFGKRTVTAERRRSTGVEEEKGRAN